MQTVLITGGTGLIGKALTKTLIEKGFEVIILTRNPEKKKSDSLFLQYAKWDINNQYIDLEVIKKADYIFHLAGTSIAEKRWSEKRKKEIVDSRVKGSELVFKLLSENENKVKAIFCASAIGWYGEQQNNADKKEDISQRGFIESDPAATDFFGQTCKLWEDANQKFALLNKRLVIFRIGILLSKEGGFLKEIKRPIDFGIAPIIGNGKQMVSWIHIDDLVRMFIWSIENENIAGIFNAVANEPVTFKELITQYAKIKRVYFFTTFYVPGFVLKIILGELSSEILKSVKVANTKIKEQGFSFLFPHIHSALLSL